jgi:hypothetical protein
MIDSSTKEKVIAHKEGSQIKIKLYSFGDMANIEDYLYERHGIEIDSFKPIKDQNGKEIGSELIYKDFKDINLLQRTIDEYEIKEE